MSELRSAVGGAASRGGREWVSKVGVAIANLDPLKEVVYVTADLDTLLTALYVLADDLCHVGGAHVDARRSPA